MNDNDPKLDLSLDLNVDSAKVGFVSGVFLWSWGAAMFLACGLFDLAERAAHGRRAPGSANQSATRGMGAAPVSLFSQGSILHSQGSILHKTAAPRR